jgi:hypothetical protein
MNEQEIVKKAEGCCKRTYSGYTRGSGIYEPFSNFIEETDKSHNGYSFIIIVLIIIIGMSLYKIYGKKMMR